MINLQEQYAQVFHTAMRFGLGAIGMKVGTRFIRFYYDQARKLWAPDPAADNTEQIHLAICDRAQVETEPQATPPSSDSERRSAFGNFANTSRKLAGAMDEVANTPDFQQPQQQRQPQQQQQEEIQPLRPLQPTVALQKQMLETGQPMVPVNDHNDDHHNHDNNDHNTTTAEKVPEQTEHQKYLARIGKGKDGCKVQTDDPTWNNDPWANEKKEMLAEIEQMRTEKQTMKWSEIKWQQSRQK